MAKTLGTNAERGRLGNSSPVYLMQITKHGSGSPDYYWATKAITVEGQTYQDMFAIEGLEKISQRIDLRQGGGVGDVSGLTFKLKNPGAAFLSDTLFSSVHNLFSNAKVEVRLTFNDCYLKYKEQTINFSVGQTVNGQTSGATGIVLQDWDAGTTGTLRLRSLTGTFNSDGENLRVGTTFYAKADGTQKTASWGNGVPIPISYIDTPEFDVNDVRFPCVDSWQKLHRKIGKLLKKEEFEDIPESNIGKIAPLIYGDFWGLIQHKNLIAVSGTFAYILYSGQTENFTLWDIVTGAASKATGRIVEDIDGGATGLLYLVEVSGTFQTSEIITGAQSGSATVSAYSAGTGTKGNPEDAAACVVVKVPTPAAANGIIIVAGHDIKDFDGLDYQLLDYHKEPEGYCRHVMRKGTSGSYSGGYYKRTGVSYFSSWKNPVKFIDIIPKLSAQSGTTTGENAVDKDPTNWMTLTADQSATFIFSKEMLTNLNSIGGGATLYFRAKQANLMDDRLKVRCYKQDELKKLNYDGQTNNFIIGRWVKGPDETGSGARALIEEDADAGTTGVLTLSRITGAFKDNETLRDDAEPDPEDCGRAIANGTLYSGNHDRYFEAEDLDGAVGGPDFVLDFNWDIGSDGFNEIEIIFAYDTVDSPDSNASIKISNIFLACYTDTQEPSIILARLKGRKFGNWIDAEGRSSSFDEDDLIENPAGVIESLLREELETTEIDTANFDALESARSGWKFAGELLEAKESLDLIDQIAYEGFFGYLQKYDGNETVFAFEPSGSPGTLNLEDICIWKAGEPKIKVKLTPISEVKNRFILHYKKNMATEDYEKLLFVDEPTQGSYSSTFTNLSSQGESFWNLCKAAYTRWGLVNTWEYNADWIRDDATAELFLKKMINWLTRQHWIVECETFLDTINLEIGDQKILSHPLLPPEIDSEYYFVLIGIEQDPPSSTLRLTWFDVGVPD